MNTNFCIQQLKKLFFALYYTQDKKINNKLFPEKYNE